MRSPITFEMTLRGQTVTVTDCVIAESDSLKDRWVDDFELIDVDTDTPLEWDLTDAEFNQINSAALYAAGEDECQQVRPYLLNSSIDSIEDESYEQCTRRTEDDWQT